MAGREAIEDLSQNQRMSKVLIIAKDESMHNAITYRKTWTTLAIQSQEGRRNVQLLRHPLYAEHQEEIA